MTQPLLGVCRTCGTVAPGGIAVGAGVQYLNAKNNIIGRCGCGGLIMLPDGDYSTDENGDVTVRPATLESASMVRRIIDAVQEVRRAAVQYPAAEVAAFAHTLREQVDSGAQPDEIVAALRADDRFERWFQQHPALAKALEGALTTVLTVVLTLLGNYALDHLDDDPPAPAPSVNVTVDVQHDVTDDDVARMVREELARRRVTAVAPAPTPARNAPCTCGSGVKYKKCCGAPGAATP